jgi:hypothetical protein
MHTFVLHSQTRKEETTMKKMTVTFAFILSVLSIQAAGIQPIADAFGSGNATMLAACMDSEVDMALPETPRT